MNKFKRSCIVFSLLLLFVTILSCGSDGGGGTDNPTPASTAKAITAFSFTSPAATGVVNEGAKTISVIVPYGTNVTALAATFTTTGASVKVGTTLQVSGTNPNDFTSAVTYTVTATDSSTATYTVTVTIAPSSAKAITAFSFSSPLSTGVIIEGAKTISITMPYGTSVTALIATFNTTGASVKVGSTIQVSGTTQNDFTSPVTYLVTAADGSTVTYAVTVILTVLTSIDVIPNNQNISIGATQQFTATGTFADNTTQNVTSSVIWSSSSTTVATISTAVGSKGLATALATGTTTITATQGSISGFTVLSTSDATAPIVPTNLSAIAITPIQITLAWTASTDNVGVTGYKIYRGGTYLYTTTTVTTSSDTDLTGVKPSTNYCYMVSAIDAVGNESAKSLPSCATTPAVVVVPIPDTGQIISYSTITGQDNVNPKHPLSYTDNANGTITDNVTGLIWQKQDDAIMRSWTDAGAYCNSLTLASYSDWRLPSPFELVTIVDFSKFNPAINTTYFPSTQPSYYWTAPAMVYPATYAWSIVFQNGIIYGNVKTNGSYVRCVRGVPSIQVFFDNGDGTVTDQVTGLMWQKNGGGLTDWEGALYTCDLPRYGYTDWRLPNVKELSSIMDTTKYSPSINTTYFTSGGPTYYYWLSTTTSWNSLYAWYMNDSTTGYELKSNYMLGGTRCVRGGY